MRGDTAQGPAHNTAASGVAVELIFLVAFRDGGVEWGGVDCVWGVGARGLVRLVS